MENRSLDNALGWLYENDTPSNFIPSHKSEPYEGLKENTYYNYDGNGNKVFMSKITKTEAIDHNQSLPIQDPNEDFGHVKIQMASNMGGFYKDYMDGDHERNWWSIMKAFTPESLPVLNGLAKNFAVSDAYFSSIPTQTDCNRAFSLAGNSIRYSDSNETYAAVNNIDDESYSDNFIYRTMWNVLGEHNLDTPEDWMVFYDEKYGEYIYTEGIFKSNLSKYQTTNFAKMEDFYSKLETGKLPKFSYLEPTWGETSYHPGNGSKTVIGGENLLYKLYKDLKDSPYWDNTLLIINFDEHGGTYDHVVPPSNARAPWDKIGDGIPKPDAKAFDFDFTHFGVRVPLILVSPLIEENTVFRSSSDTPFDHTSVIATILNHFKIQKSEWKMGSRVANAPTFENVITRTTPRKNNIEIPYPLILQDELDDALPNDLQLTIVERMFADTIEKKGYSKKKFDALHSKYFQNVKTIKDIHLAKKQILKELVE